MILIIEKEQIELYPITDDVKKNFERRTDCDLTSFERFWLQKTGELLSKQNSQHFWVNDAYTWWERENDEKGNPVKDHEFSVWLDKCGNCMYDDHDNDKLYRVFF